VDHSPLLSAPPEPAATSAPPRPSPCSRPRRRPPPRHRGLFPAPIRAGGYLRATAASSLLPSTPPAPAATLRRRAHLPASFRTVAGTCCRTSPCARRRCPTAARRPSSSTSTVAGHGGRGDLQYCTFFFFLRSCEICRRPKQTPTWDPLNYSMS
jgi:hypothetical protein